MLSNPSLPSYRQEIISRRQECNTQFHHAVGALFHAYVFLHFATSAPGVDRTVLIAGSKKIDDKKKQVLLER